MEAFSSLDRDGEAFLVGVNNIGICQTITDKDIIRRTSYVALYIAHRKGLPSPSLRSRKPSGLQTAWIADGERRLICSVF